eukprot:gene12638-2309_t
MRKLSGFQSGLEHMMTLMPTIFDGSANNTRSGFFSRQDESEDALFYAEPRFVVHIDKSTIAALTEAYRDVLFPGASVLDLMSSWVSHLPEEMELCHVAGLGMNLVELERNPRLDNAVVQNLNTNPELPFPNAVFDCVLNAVPELYLFSDFCILGFLSAFCIPVAVSVQYLTRPVEVFSSILRVLKPGGLSVVAMSHRCFPTKAIHAFRQLPPPDRVNIVRSYYSIAGFEDPVFLD